MGIYYNSNRNTFYYKNGYYVNRKKGKRTVTPTPPPPELTPVYPIIENPKTGMTGTIVEDYQILLTGGGLTVRNSTQDNYILNLKYNYKVILNSYPIKVTSQATTKKNNEIFFFSGGADSIYDNGIRYNKNYLFNKKTETFLELPDLKRGLERHSINFYENSLVVLGGIYGNGRGTGATDEAYKINLDTLTITDLINLPTLRAGHATVSKDDFIYIFTGQIDSGAKVITSCFKYSIITNVFDSIPSNGYGSSCMTILNWGDDISIVGGYGLKYARHRKNENFKINTNVWSRYIDLDYLISDAVGGVLDDENAVIISGRPAGSGTIEGNYTAEATDKITFFNRVENNYIYKE